MQKLTVIKAKALLQDLSGLRTIREELFRQALEIALPTLEQQERGEGWIEWGGGNCPVHVNHAVEVKLRDGTVSSALPTDGWVWEHGVLSSGADIIAYRIIPERATNQNGEQ